MTTNRIATVLRLGLLLVTAVGAVATDGLATSGAAPEAASARPAARRRSRVDGCSEVPPPVVEAAPRPSVAACGEETR